MQGNAPGIDGRNPGGRQDHQFLTAVIPDIFQESGFPCTGLSGQEDMLGRLVHKLQRELKFGIGKVCFRHPAI